MAIVSLRSLSTAHKGDTTLVVEPGPTVDPGTVGPTGGTQQCTHSYDSKGICTKCGEMYPYKVTETYFEVKLTAEAYVQSKPYGDPAYYQDTQSYVGGKYTVIGTAVNHYGTTWYEIARDRWICSDRCELVGQRDFVTISGETSPSGTLQQGSSSGPVGDGYTYGGRTYDVVPNFRSEYCFDQNDYARFENSSGKNRGCTATAMCIAYSIYHDTTLSPNSVAWSSGGTNWEYCTRYADASQTYKGGTVRTLSYFNSLDCGWALRIPV